MKMLTIVINNAPVGRSTCNTLNAFVAGVIFLEALSVK